MQSQGHCIPKSAYGHIFFLWQSSKMYGKYQFLEMAAFWLSFALLLSVNAVIEISNEQTSCCKSWNSCSISHCGIQNHNSVKTCGIPFVKRHSMYSIFILLKLKVLFKHVFLGKNPNFICLCVILFSYSGVSNCRYVTLIYFDKICKP